MAKHTRSTWVSRLADWVFRCLLAHSILSAHFAFKAHFLREGYWPAGAVAPWDWWAVTGLGKVYIGVITGASQRLGLKGNPLHDHAAPFIGAVYTLAFLWPLVVRLLFVPFCQQAQIRRDLWFQVGLIKPNKPWK